MSLSGILHLAIQPNSYNAESFRDFIDGLLDEMQPWPEPNSVIVLDNASIHKGAEVRAMVEAR